jgi:uncharacterized tellurite resistance protein B-like protein
MMLSPLERDAMPIFSKKQEPLSPKDAASLLRHAVVTEMAGADEETVRIVTAVAGLLATVAYADRVFAPEEVEHVRTSIGRIHGMTPQSTNVICGVLSRHLAELSTLHSHAFTRELKELTEPHVRLEILDVLVDLAAADGEISLPEVNQLRQLTVSLGLSQADYNASQARHRDKLTSLS